MTEARRLLSGSALRVLSMLSSIVVSFYMMPFLVHSLGDRWYGFWALAGTIVGYYGLLDLGLGTAAHRFLAIATARGDREEASTVFTTLLGLFGVGGAVALGLTGIAWLAAPFGAAPEDLHTFRLVLLLLGVNFALGFPMQVFNGIFAANLRYDLSSYVQLAKLIGRSAIVVVAIGRSPSVVTLAAVTLGVDIIANIAAVILAVRLWPWLQLSRRHFDRGKVRELFGFGLYALLIRVGDLFRFGMDHVVIAAVLGLASVTHYGIAMRLVDYFQELMNNLFGVFAPLFSRYHGLEDDDTMLTRVRQASRLAVAVSASFAGAAIIFGAPFISRWMGPAYIDAYAPLVILMTAAFISVMQNPSTSYLLAIAGHRYYAMLNGFDALANFGLSLLLAPRFGMVGVAVATAIPTLVVKLVFQPRYVCSRLGFPVRAYWREVGRVLLVAVPSQVIIGAIVWLVKPASYPVIFSMALGLYALHAVVMYLYALPAQDQQVLARAVPKLKYVLAIRSQIAGVVGGASGGSP